jgi:hypothetical protein
MATPQSISRFIKNLDVWKSETSKGRVSDFVTEGYKVQNINNEIFVQYVSASNNFRSTDLFRKRQFLAVEKMFVELSQAGYEVILEFPAIKVGA